MRGLIGLDRSTTPPATLRGQPLHPVTLPNAVGFVRLALIPVFLALAFESSDGRSESAALVFAIIGASDYLDGLLARLTGQYSRLGALLDPLVDRLFVLSGVVVTWHFDLLPHWGLGILAAREVLVLVMTRVALHRGGEIEIHPVGRWAVWPTMLSLFLALVADTWIATGLLLLGVVLTLAATVLYARKVVPAWRGPSTSA
jgi:cardiolipin synthase